MLSARVLSCSLVILVVVAHPVGSECLGSTLVGTHLGKLNLHPELSHEVFQVVGRRAQTAPVDLAQRVNPHLVGHATDVVGALHVLVAIGNNPFSALLEVEQGLADGVARGGRVHLQGTGLDIDTFHVVVFLGGLDGGQDVVESHRAVSFSHHFRQEVASASFVDYSAKRQHQHRVVLDGGFRIARGQHSDDGNDSEEAHDSKEKGNAHHCGKYILKKILHSNNNCLIISLSTNSLQRY